MIDIVASEGLDGRFSQYNTEQEAQSVLIEKFCSSGLTHCSQQNCRLNTLESQVWIGCIKHFLFSIFSHCKEIIDKIIIEQNY